MSEVTRILRSVEHGESSANRLLPLVYDELRKLAAHKMANEPSGHTLQPTALVHEAWYRLAGAEETTWRNRAHFFGAAAEAMRRILVERTRRKRRIQHGGDQEHVNWNDIGVAAPATDEKILLVNDALDKLADNVLAGNEQVSQDNWLGVGYDRATYAAAQQFAAPPVTTEPPKAAYEHVLKDAGAILPRRDVVDQRTVREVRTETLNVVNWVKDVGGWPDFPSTADPLPNKYVKPSGLTK